MVQATEEELKTFLEHQTRRIKGIHANILETVTLCWMEAEINYKQTKDKNYGIKDLHYTDSIIVYEDGTWRHKPKGRDNNVDSVRE